MPDQERANAKGAWNMCKEFMTENATLIGATEDGFQLFIASHEALLRFLAGCPTYTAKVQIEVFSLSDPEAQLVPQGETGDPGMLESYRISVSQEG